MTTREVDLRSPYDMSEIAGYATALTMTKLLGRRRYEELNLGHIDRQHSTVDENLVRRDFFKRVMTRSAQHYVNFYEDFHPSNRDHENLARLTLFNAFASYGLSYADGKGEKLAELQAHGFDAYAPRIRELAAYSLRAYGNNLYQDASNLPEVFLQARYASAVWLGEEITTQSIHAETYLPNDSGTYRQIAS